MSPEVDSPGGGGTASTAEPNVTTSPSGAERPTPESTLAAVRQRGALRCGVNQGLAGFTEFSETDAAAQQVDGFDADFCRALAAAVLGDASKVDFVPLSTADRFASLESGEIDVLIRNTTYTGQRDLTFDFGPVTFHDGQQILAREDDGFSLLSGVVDLEGRTVCVNQDSTSETNIRAAVEAAGVPNVQLREVPNIDTGMTQFEQGACDAVTSDGSALVVQRRTRERSADSWVIFPSKPLTSEPFAPVYRSNDSQWADVVNWTVYATIVAEARGITSSTAHGVRDEAIASPERVDSESQALLGVKGSFAADLGLSVDAFFDVIVQVGNYGEIYRTNLGRLGFARPGTPNASVDDGGLMWAPPIGVSE